MNLKTPTTARCIAVYVFLFILLVSAGLPQTPNQVNDPSNPVPEYGKRAAEARGNGPSFQEVGQRARESAVWPGSRQRSGMTSEDRKRIKALLTPEREDIERHREFLEQKDTGIFRLYPDFDCASKRLVSLAGKCANQVYNGSFYSFRESKFSDLQYKNGKLSGSGFFSHEILVDLGDVPLDKLDLDSDGVKFLNAYSPAADFVSANRQFREIVSGLESGGLKFSRGVVPLADHTYAVRIIAFDNNNNLQKRRWRRSWPEPLLGWFQAVQRDKRSDIIVAFRIIRLADDGNITVLWKRLSRKKAPVIKFDDDGPLNNFK